jgi:predicted TPR repeat methyltransferase
MPGEPAPWNNLGNVLVEMQRFDEAVAAYERCLSLAPSFTDALNNLATIYRKRGLHARSEALCREVVALQPGLAQGWYNLSLTLLEQGLIEEGLQANSRATVLWPRHLQARNAVPRALVHLGRLDEAAQLYREWLSVDPDNPVIHHHLAACSGSNVPNRASDGYVERTFDAFASTFDANLAALNYQAPQLVAKLIHQLFPDQTRSLVVADLGCGTGLCGPLIRDLAAQLHGCDLSAGMLDKAAQRRTYDALHHQELVAYLTKHPSTYDALVCADTLCYFGELAQAMASAASALRSGGAFVFTVEALPEGAEDLYHLQPHGRYAHQCDYVTNILRNSGLEVIALQREVLRLEAGRPVNGWLIGAVRRPP